MRRSSWPRLWRSCGWQVSPGGREGESARGGGAVRGPAERRGGDPHRADTGTGRRCDAWPSPPGVVRSRSRRGEGRRRLRPSAGCGGRSESAGSAAPRRQPRICGRARAGRCRRPGRPRRRIPSAPRTCAPLAGVAASRPAPQDAGLGCGRGEGIFFFIAAAPGPQPPRRSCFLIPLLSIARQSSFQERHTQLPKAAVLRAASLCLADAAPAPAGEQRGATGRVPVTSGPARRLWCRPRKTLQESLCVCMHR